ncbi:MAG: hypothetical protein IJ795_02630 [Bacteroidales bacterium]|nr:hypothetical protein [Bacteroidales bacterium]
MNFNSLIIRSVAAALAMTACARETEIAPVPAGEDTVTYSFRAVMEGSSKASVSEDGTCSWTQGDQIAVYNAVSGTFCTFTSELGDGLFTFTGEPGADYEFTHAYYPASIAKATSTITLPDEITLKQATSGSGFPMFGTREENNTLSFRHMGALLKYTLVGIPETADALVLSSPEVSISGDFSVAESDNVINATSGNGTVRIPLESGASKSLVFYLPLPLGTYTFNCDVMAGEQALASHATKSSKEVQRAKLIRMRPVTPEFGGGRGTEEDPFLITSADDLKTLSYVCDDETMRSSFYKQTADIDLENVAFSPICTLDLPFTGGYDGDGHSISNLNVSTSGANAGLFGYLRGATVKNIEIKSATIKSGANYAGAITGVLNEGVISGCRVDENSTVSSAARGAGGVVGFVRAGTISGCASHACMSAETDIAGGIAGYLNTNAATQEILVINCTFDPVYKDGKMTAASLKTGNANAFMGGISGSANATDGMGTIKIANCYAYPLEMVSTQAAGTKVAYIGGITGRIVSAGVTIYNCLTPVTYSNVIIGGSRIDAKTYKNLTAAACITGTVSQDGSTISRVISKNTWPVCTYTSKSVDMSNVSIKTGDGNMRGFGGFAFSSDWTVNGKRTYSEAEGGILAALNDGVTAWNTDNPDATAVAWEYDATFGYPKPSGIDVPGVTTKKVSIIGDSISTYQGYIFSTDDLQMNAFYPDASNTYDNMVLNEQETWWWKIIYDKMSNARLEVDNAFGGSTVSYTEAKIDGMAKDPNDRMMENSFQLRYLNYGVGEPDILICHGGRNDFGQFGGNTDVLLGSYTKSALQSAYEAEEGELFNNFSAGTVAILRDFHAKFPEAKVLIIVHDMMSDGYAAAAKAITKFLSGKGFDIRYVNLHKTGTNNATNTDIGITKEGGTHPNSVGCTNMANYIFENYGEWLEGPYVPGEEGGDDDGTEWESEIENFELEDESSVWE